MRTIVAHQGADLDALMSAWILKRFKVGWENASLEFVPAGSRLEGEYSEKEGVVEEMSDGREIIHVDTGLGPLDHHHTDDMNLCAAKLTFDWVLQDSESSLQKHETKREALSRMVAFAVDIDHFQELFYSNPSADVYEMTVVGIIDGYKMTHEFDDWQLAEYIFESFDALLHTFENKIFAEREIRESGYEFESKWGSGFAIESVNDAVMKEAIKLGYALVVRRDPNHGFLRIKTLPAKRGEVGDEIDLTPMYERLVKEDPDATWFLHASKRMLLNGSSKNPKSRASNKSLEEVVEMLKQT